jgi:integrase
MTKLNTVTARAKLAVRGTPYYHPLAHGIRIGYRRTTGPAGTWTVRVEDAGGEWMKKIGIADDGEKADGAAILNFDQASELALHLARNKNTQEIDTARPLTVKEALDQYERDLATRGGDLSNAKRARDHVTPALNAKLVMALTAADLRAWRDSVLAKGLAPATVNRTRTCLRAALELAASLDKRIKNAAEFKLGLKGLPPGSNGGAAPMKVLPDAEVWAVVDGAYAVSESVGVLVQVLAETGTRMSQAVRIACGDFHGDTLAVPMSNKGGAGKDRPHALLPISHELGARLRRAVAGRPDHAPLLLKADGSPWHLTDKTEHRRPFIAAVVNAGLNAEEITPYALRHSAICRWLIAGVPAAIVAKRCDTSVAIIEKHYAKFLLQADQANRRGVLKRPAGDNVVSLSA